MLHQEVLTTVALDLLRGIQQNSLFADTRLVGGTALALLIGHRRSIDLDFFGPVDLSPADLALELESYGKVSRRGSSRRIQGFMISGVQVDFVDYPYPWLSAPVENDGVRLAGQRSKNAFSRTVATVTNQ